MKFSLDFHNLAANYLYFLALLFMGKPFSKELEQLEYTLSWSLAQEIEPLRSALLHQKKPLIVVGSGGSLSACHFAVLLYQQFGIMAKTVTPLELHYAQKTIRESNVFFITASGRNNDIIFAYKTAIDCDPGKLFSICMKLDSPLEQLAAAVSNSAHFSYNLPTGNDGFLATNSLIAFFGLLAKALSVDSQLISAQLFSDVSSFGLDRFFEQVDHTFTFTILYAGWGQPVGADLESKLAEAALGDVLVSDYRNFGHGRHHWFDKRGKTSCIIALITPDEKEIATKTFNLLPKDIPILYIETSYAGPQGAIELLIKSYYFVEALGKCQGIDPGRPGVPDYGSHLYHLNYQQLYRVKQKKNELRQHIAIIRKANIALFSELSTEEQSYWNDSYVNFLKKLQKAHFGSVVFDYDGTICSAKNRFTGLDIEVIPHLLKILSSGFIIGIATGRGKSVKTALREAIPETYWQQVVIGYYNCSEIGLLSDDHIPDKEMCINESLQHLHTILETYDFPVKVSFEIKPCQLTIQIDQPDNWKKVRGTIIQLIMLENLPNIQILESSHSMDIIDQLITNKLNIKSHCERLMSKRGIGKDCLFIGDKGQWPGNDYQLLSEDYTLSVDEVSPLHNNCWNLAMPSIKNIQATIYYLSCLDYKPLFLNLKIK